MSSRSLVVGGAVAFLFLAAFWKASLLLVGIVSSRMLSMTDMSCLASKVLPAVGIVAGGESDALRVGISAYRWTDAGS